MLHPATALEHALPILALGLLAGQQGARAARSVLLVVPLALLLGAALAPITPPLPWVPALNLLRSRCSAAWWLRPGRSRAPP
jgi:urease accessory protein